MQYNRLNGIVQKALKYTLNGQDKGYTLNYEYNDKKHPHAPSSISGIAPFGGQGAGKPRNYQYDGNGNPTYYDEFKGFRSMVWDEENRLRGINDNGRLHLYTYDHTGERALKSSAESSMAVINGLASAVITHTEDYTAYVSPYFVVQKGKFTKHYFEGSSRIVSKLGEGTFSHKNTGIMAGGLDYLKRTQKEQEARDRYIKGLNVPPGPPTQHGIYATPEWTKQPYPSIDWEAISQNQEPPAGWPRYPRFNEPGDVPGPPVQYGEPLTNANVRAGFNFIPNGVEEKNIYYYHPDHLGSSSYITDKNGEVIQHTEYIAFGEVLVDEHSTTNKMPYLFNGKELDYETGLYYYGARYYDPKTSIFLNVDPLVEKTGTPYAYTYNNPIRYIDPTGMQGEDWVQRDKQIFWDASVKSQADAERLYGKNVKHLGEGATFTTSVGGNVVSQYTFHSNGTYSDMNGNTMDKTKNVTTAGGTTIFANCESCLNPGSLYKNLLGLSYPGGDNPTTYGIDGKNITYSYEYVPELLSEYPAIGHDRRYDNLEIKGAGGLFFDTRAIGADWRFVAEEMAIAYNPLNGASIKDRIYAYGLGTGLGVAAIPKTFYQLNKGGPLMVPINIYQIIKDYQESNKGVTNQPTKR